MSINFISIKYVSSSTSKYTVYERGLIKSLVATLSLKRIPDAEIVKEIERQTDSSFTISGLAKVKEQLKKESHGWFKLMRQDQYAYIHEYKSRIEEIESLQKKANQIIDKNEHNPQIQLSAISELHKLNITLSNYIEVLPTVINNYGTSISTTPEDKTTQNQQKSQQNQSLQSSLAILKDKPFWIWDKT